MTFQLAGKRVTVMGLGTRAGGLGVARYLAQNGAVVTVTDMKTEAELAEPIAELTGLPIRFVLGRHDERDFTPTGADIVIRNPGVRRTSRYLALARETGIDIEMEMSLFFRLCPAPIIGITGTKGKTSTSALCGEMLSAWHPNTVVAGNMGVSAVERLSNIDQTTPVVIELSSWQLEALDEHKLAPRIAVITNVSEDHLDAYDGFDDYARTKRSLAHHLRPDDVLVVNAGDAEAWRAVSETKATVVPFGVGDRGRDGAWVETGQLIWRRRGEETQIPVPINPALAGSHQEANFAAAAAAALLRGAPPTAIESGLARFNGVRNRLEPVAEIDGVLFVNDTAATAPAAAIAGLGAFPGRRIHWIAGGSDKRTDLSALARAGGLRAATILLLDGSATAKLSELLVGCEANALGPFPSMSDAVSNATRRARPGDVVLLSPGCASFGMFRDEYDRGDQFRAAVQAIASLASSPR